MAKRVNAEEFEAEVLKASLPVIVEFYSDSCIPCKQLSPVLGGIEDDYEDKLIVVKVNVNFDAELAQKGAGTTAQRATINFQMRHIFLRRFVHATGKRQLNDVQLVFQEVMDNFDHALYRHCLLCDHQAALRVRRG